MTDDELMQAVLLALTRQNVTGSGGGGTPLPLTIGYIQPIFVFDEWVGEMGFMVLTEVT
jgi:hypothetical protein